MPYATVFALSSQRPTALPPFLGPFAFSAVCQRLATIAPTIGARVQHDSNEPLTVTVLYDHSWLGPAFTPPQSQLWLRVTVLDDTLHELVLQALTPGTTLILADQPFQLQQVNPSPPHPLAGQMSYQELAQRWLTPLWLPATLRLRLFTPLWYDPTDELLPIQPGWLFTRLAARWNTFAPVALEPALIHGLQHALRLSAYGLQPRHITWDNQHQQSVTGWIALQLEPADPALRSALHVLGAFAFYAGLGKHTAIGFGQARPIGPGHSPVPNARRPHARG